MSEKKTKGPRPLKAGWYQISVVRCRDQERGGKNRFRLTEEALVAVPGREGMLMRITDAAQALALGWDQDGNEHLAATAERKRRARAEELLAKLGELGVEVDKASLSIAGPQIPGAGQEGEPLDGDEVLAEAVDILTDGRDRELAARGAPSVAAQKERARLARLGVEPDEEDADQ